MMTAFTPGVTWGGNEPVPAPRNPISVSASPNPIQIAARIRFTSELTGADLCVRCASSQDPGKADRDDHCPAPGDGDGEKHRDGPGAPGLPRSLAGSPKGSDASCDPTRSPGAFHEAADEGQVVFRTVRRGGFAHIYPLVIVGQSTLETRVSGANQHVKLAVSVGVASAGRFGDLITVRATRKPREPPALG